MAKKILELKEKELEIAGKIIGENTPIKLSVKTALWSIGGVFSLVMIILAYSYFDLKKDVYQKHETFMKEVNANVEKIKDNIGEIKINQETIKGDIKLILDRSNRDNPIKSNRSVDVEPSSPPISSGIVNDNNLHNTADN